ncbi:MAG TPA: M24 family metallopeptidase [Gemmatimonadales bacterium]|nr:M24 family metallopeptidase [Gemmatimonadales bacterium]
MKVVLGMRSRFSITLLLAGLTLLPRAAPLEAQEARRRWERLCTIRADKFDLVLPQAMRENGIDMWITMMKEGLLDPLWEDLGRGYVGGPAYYIFADRGGDRVERVAAGVSGYMLEQCGVYDSIITGPFDLGRFVAARDPRRIGVNMSEQLGPADGLSHTNYQALMRALGERYAARVVSAEKLISDYRSRRVASELVAFGEAAELSRTIAEQALSNRVITPGLTMLEDVAWWMWDQLLARGLGSSFDMPSVYITGPRGIEATSNRRIIQRGDFMMIDWGVCFLNFCTDVKRVAYVLKPDETAAPPGLQHAFDRALAVRAAIRPVIRAGPTAAEIERAIHARLEQSGFGVIAFNRPTDRDITEVVVGAHSVGNTGHGIGPSIAFFNPLQLTYQIKPTNLFSFEFFAYTKVPEWGGAKARIPIEDDMVVTERGVEWLYPVVERILLIR